ncbi:MAG: hypothetical protein MUF61_02065 [archaeon]|jgi:uncharacterized membrane protein|nr:hypothetical protein [archaeon]
MKKQAALKVILLLSVAGLLFSGYLSYTEIFQNAAGYCYSASCSSEISGIPVCVYGFVMYLIIFVLSILGLNAKK